MNAVCAMLEMSWITAVLQLYSQVADIFGNVIVKRINMIHFDLLARFHYILNLPRTLRERLRTDKVFTKDQCFCLNYYKFSIKSYVLDLY